jgi:hypothetical protein
MEARQKMGHALENELYTIEQKVHDIFHRRLTARELAIRVHEAEIIQNLDHPRENRREEQSVYLSWLPEYCERQRVCFAQEGDILCDKTTTVMWNRIKSLMGDPRTSFDWTGELDCDFLSKQKTGSFLRLQFLP